MKKILRNYCMAWKFKNPYSFCILWGM